MSDTIGFLNKVYHGQWTKEFKDCCGTCKYCNPSKDIMQICTNPKSQYFKDYVDISDGCNEYFNSYGSN